MIYVYLLIMCWNAMDDWLCIVKLMQQVYEWQWWRNIERWQYSVYMRVCFAMWGWCIRLGDEPFKYLAGWAEGQQQVWPGVWLSYGRPARVRRHGLAGQDLSRPWHRYQQQLQCRLVISALSSTLIPALLLPFWNEYLYSQRGIPCFVLYRTVQTHTQVHLNP